MNKLPVPDPLHNFWPLCKCTQLWGSNKQLFCELFTLTGQLLVSGRTGRCSRRKQQPGRAKPPLPNMVHSCHGPTALPLPLPLLRSPSHSSPFALLQPFRPPFDAATPSGVARAQTLMHARKHAHEAMHPHFCLIYDIHVRSTLCFRAVACFLVSVDFFEKKYF